MIFNCPIHQMTTIVKLFFVYYRHIQSNNVWQCNCFEILFTWQQFCPRLINDSLWNIFCSFFYPMKVLGFQISGYIRIRTNSFIRYSLGNSGHCCTTKRGSFRVKSLATPLLPITLEKLLLTICSSIFATYSMNSSLGIVRPPYVLVGDSYPLN